MKDCSNSAGAVGVTVTGTAPQRSAVVAKARELVEVARWHGLGLEELVQVIRQVS